MSDPNSSTISVSSFMTAVGNYPVPPDFNSTTFLTAAHPNLSKAKFLCRKKGLGLSPQESFFLFLTNVDPDLNVSICSQQSRFLLLQLALASVEGTEQTEFATKYLHALCERAHAGDLSEGSTVKQREFFELWYTSPHLDIGSLNATQRNALSSLRRSLASQISKTETHNPSKKYPGAKLVVKLLATPFWAMNPVKLQQPAFRLSTLRRERSGWKYVPDELFDSVWDKLGDLEMAEKVGVEFGKLGERVVKLVEGNLGAGGI